MNRTLLGSLVLGVVACGSPGAATQTAPITAGPFGNTNNQTGCAAAASLVYVVSAEDELYSFRPDESKFTKIGALRCASRARPNSMAVDRSGTAWVNYEDGTLWSVSTKDASCKQTTFAAGQSGFTKFGMAFTTKGKDASEETLYVAGVDHSTSGKGLATIDLETMTLTRVGDFSGDLQGLGAELTGTGDGRLFGFFTTRPDATLARVDGTSGSTTDSTDLAGIVTGEAWAFSFWGGDFWFYTSDGVASSTVSRLRTSGDGSLKVAEATTSGFHIVGAGVSTCAPTAPPH